MRSPQRVLHVEEARVLGEWALCGVGFSSEEARIIADDLIDAALCGHDFAGLPRILAIAEDPPIRQARSPIKIVHETNVSLLLAARG